MTMRKDLKEYPEEYAAWKAKRAAYARSRYHAKKNDAAYVQKKRESNLKSWYKTYPINRLDPKKVEKNRAQQREYYHKRGKFIRKEKRNDARRAAVSVGEIQQKHVEQIKWDSPSRQGASGTSSADVFGAPSVAK
jgi:hypothetical protein